MIDRRHFFGYSAAALALSPTKLSQAQPIVRARKPTAPYRVWFQPRCFHRDMSLYRHMTIDASGWLDPALCELAGRTGLRWVYGTNHPDASGPEYWQRECSRDVRTVSSDGSPFAAAGVAIDEWVTPKRPHIEDGLAAGLRAAKEADANLFISVWYTDLRTQLVELIHDGTVDLAIIEGYTHTPARFGPDAWLAWPSCLRRCDAAAHAETLTKTIFCFGHVTDEPNGRNQHLDPGWLDERVHEIKERYPTMPGIAFYQSDSPDTPELRNLVQHCDRLSGQLWT